MKSSSEQEKILEDHLYTHIHGRWYDLTDWASSHPGGLVSLSLAAGRDGTILFEQSHPLTDRRWLASIMSEHEVSLGLSRLLHERYPSVALEASNFSFEFAADTLFCSERVASTVQDAFEAEVKGIARDYFLSEARRRGVSLREAMKATPQRWFVVALLGVLFFGFGVVPLLKGWFPACFIAPTLGWICSYLYCCLLSPFFVHAYVHWISAHLAY